MSNRSDPNQHQDLGVDVVPGDPPVPVNIWRLPASDDTPVGDRLAARLLAEYTRPGELVYDTVPSPPLRKAAQAAGRGYRAANRFQTPDRAALAVATWPVTDTRLDPVLVLGGLRRRLQPGGYLAVIVPPVLDGPGGRAPVELGPLVAVATTARLAYLQHVVTMPTTAPPASDPTAATTPGARVHEPAHERVHTDILVFRRIGAADG